MKRVILVLAAVSLAAAAHSQEPAVDKLGDELPAGALARLGSRRWLARGHVRALTWSADGNKIVAATRQ